MRGARQIWVGPALGQSPCRRSGQWAARKTRRGRSSGGGMAGKRWESLPLGRTQAQGLFSAEGMRLSEYQGNGDVSSPLPASPLPGDASQACMHTSWATKAKGPGYLRSDTQLLVTSPFYSDAVTQSPGKESSFNRN